MGGMVEFVIFAGRRTFKNMKSNAKEESFYHEANEMSRGWGNYMRKIDELKDKIASNNPLSLKEFCWTLYGEGHCSSTWESFAKYAEENKHVKYEFNTWTAIFKKWQSEKI